MSRLQNHLSALGGIPHHAHLDKITRGVEKESLRINPQGALALTPHSTLLGSALMHPDITTDFSESLLEFITAPTQDIAALLQQLDNIHRFTYQTISDEMLWVNSMPCVLGDDNAIPVAQYGASNVAKMKTIYRQGLSQRYGRAMQTIAGIHYNFSLPDAFWLELQQLEKNQQSLRDYKTQRYFDLIRNFRRYFWLLIYCYGAAPAVCPTFVANRKHELHYLTANKKTLHGPYATSLRMGNLGYQSNAQKSLLVNYNNLPNYLVTLCKAITCKHPDYQKIGLRDAKGDYLQLNEGLLQIENEFYSSIRPKRSVQFGETALHALFERGVEYIEVRCVDLNPFEPLGLNREQIRFLDSFLVFCLLADSPQADEDDFRRVQTNQQRIVNAGRDPQLQLVTRKGERSIQEWATRLLNKIAQTAEILDSAMATREHSQAVAKQHAKLADVSLTPSAQVLRELKEQDASFFQLAFTQAKQTAEYFRQRPLEGESLAHYQQLAKESLANQRALEAEDQLDFETYRQRFYAQYDHCSTCG